MHLLPGEYEVMMLKPWWTRDPVLRLLSDLIMAELSRLRPGLLGVRRAPDARLGLSGQGGADLHPDLGALGLDSLEFLDLATAVVVQFHLHETGLDDALMADARLDHWVETILRSRARWDEAISFQTSGSTGRPKICTHRMAFLEQEIAHFADRLHDRRRLLCAVPSHHIYGFLFSVMLPAALGIPVLDVRDALPGSALRQAQPGDLLIGHPTFFDLATRGPVSVAADIVAVSSTAPCPEPVWRRLGESGFAEIIEVYGASETAGIGERTAPDAPFRLLPQWSRDRGSNTRIARLLVIDEAVPVELPDQVQWVDDNRFHVLGRRDGAVQVGGINVFPRRVERCVREHPEVADALVRLAGAEQDGRLKAFVVPSAGCADPQHLSERLHVWLAERLTPAERPRTITVGAQLPRSRLGKSIDWD